jgi:hypothetical protein
MTYPVPFPDGVASPDAEAAFVALRTGGVRGIDLRSGRDLWTIDRPARPLMVIGNRLGAEDRAESRDNVLQLVLLNLDRQGAVDRRVDPIVLPEWVSVADPDQPFEYRVRAEGDSLAIDWSATSHYAGGAPPPPSVVAHAARAGHGRARVDLQTGRVQSEAGDSDAERSAAAPAARAVNRGASGSNDVAQRLPADAHSPSVVGDRLFYLVERAERSGEGPSLVSVDLHSGRTMWERTLPARWTRPPARRS